MSEDQTPFKYHKLRADLHARIDTEIDEYILGLEAEIINERDKDLSKTTSYKCQKRDSDKLCISNQSGLIVFETMDNHVVVLSKEQITKLITDLQHRIKE